MGELGQIRQRPLAAGVGAGDLDVHVERVFPRPPAQRTRFELGQVDVAQREPRQRLEQRARLAVQGEDDGRLVGVRRSAASFAITQNRVMLSAKSWIDSRSTARPKTSAARRDATAAASRRLSVPHHLRRAGRVVDGHDLDAAHLGQRLLDLRQRLRVRVDDADVLDRASRGGRAGNGRRGAPPRRRSAARARRADRSCGGCCRRWSSPSAGCRAWRAPPRRRRRPLQRWGRGGRGGRGVVERRGFAVGAGLALECDEHAAL